MEKSKPHTGKLGCIFLNSFSNGYSHPGHVIPCPFSFAPINTASVVPDEFYCGALTVHILKELGNIIQPPFGCFATVCGIIDGFYSIFLLGSFQKVICK